MRVRTLYLCGPAAPPVHLRNSASIYARTHSLALTYVYRVMRAFSFSVSEGHSRRKHFYDRPTNPVQFLIRTKEIRGKRQNGSENKERKSELKSWGIRKLQKVRFPTASSKPYSTVNAISHLLEMLYAGFTCSIIVIYST